MWMFASYAGAILAAILLFSRCTLPISAPEPISTPELVIGDAGPLPVVQASTVSSVSDECAELPLVHDVRAADDPSLSVLPRLGEHEYQRLKDFYHFEENYTLGCQRANSGQRYWDLYAIEFKCGPAILQPQLKDTNGLPADGILTFMSWPGAEQFPQPVDPPYKSNGVWCWSDSTGSCGWGYGGESHIGPDGGPYIVWPSSDPADWADRRVGSDALDRIGWWDNHCTPNPVFKDRRKAGGVVPSDGYALVDTDESGNEIGFIPFQVGEPPVGARLLILRSPEGVDLGFVPWKDE